MHQQSYGNQQNIIHDINYKSSENPPINKKINEKGASAVNTAATTKIMPKLAPKIKKH